jgi:hypothetical protein
MASHIEQTIQDLASQFVHSVLQALSGASLQELSALAGGGGRSGRASSGGARGRGRGAAPARGRGRPPASAAAKEAPASSRGRRGGRRVRRSSEDVSSLAAKVSDFVSESGGNVAVSDIAKALGVSTQDITRPVAIALQEGKIYKEGEKRLTRYFTNEGKRRGKKLPRSAPVCIAAPPARGGVAPRSSAAPGPVISPGPRNEH